MDIIWSLHCVPPNNILHKMQAQIPFTALRIIHSTLDQRSPEADSFLWDGSYELPTLHLNMHITSLSCIPNQDLFKAVLMDFNTLVRITFQIRIIDIYNACIMTCQGYSSVLVLGKRGIVVTVVNYVLSQLLTEIRTLKCSNPIWNVCRILYSY